MNWEQLLSYQQFGDKVREHRPGRSAFEQDYDRIIFSHPFRRLQDKTQVHPLPEHDFVHTRLTHSLEVSSVGRSLGKLVGDVVLQRDTKLAEKFSIHDFGAIVATASLAHDIGNPPFGHSGEDAISEFFKCGEGLKFEKLVNKPEWHDLINFEGNAQGFRILNKEQYQGLRLTYASLAAFSKYPRQSFVDKIDQSRRSQKKYGFFQSEKENFKSVAEATGLPNYESYMWGRHPLAFLVEAADDICYHLIDLEDGCRMGLVSYDDTIALFSELLGKKFQLDKLNRITSVDERIGTLRALSIGQLIDECITLFLDEEQNMLSGTFDIALTDLIPSSKVLSHIIEISIRDIYRSRQVVETEAAGFEVLPGLLEAFTSAAHEKFTSEKTTKRNKSLLNLLPPETQMELKNSTSTYQVLMTCIDYVSGLTDTHAISLFRKIKGISLGNF